MNQKEGEIDELINFIFNNEPKPPHSIKVSFDNIDVKKLFEYLLMIFTYGMRMNYSNPENKTVDLSTLSSNDLIEFNRYMNSISIQLSIETEPVNINKDYEKLKYTNVNINSETKLNELKLPFLSNDIVYIISFDYL